MGNWRLICRRANERTQLQIEIDAAARALLWFLSWLAGSLIGLLTASSAGRSDAN